MKGCHAFLLAAVLAGGAPWLRAPAKEASRIPFPGWPSEWEGRPLHRLPLTLREQRFAAGFPGRMAHFSDGQRQILLRWVNRETRQLHPAADCFRGSGYSIEPAALVIDSEAARWGCFQARRGGENLRVCERIIDTANHSWTDVSSWYWSAAMGSSAAPWWAVTVVEQGGSQ